MSNSRYQSTTPFAADLVRKLKDEKFQEQQIFVPGDISTELANDDALIWVGTHANRAVSFLDHINGWVRPMQSGNAI